jgi:O-antigen ligase
MSRLWRQLRSLLLGVLRSCLLLIAFLGAWWLRPSYPEGLRPPPEPYFLGFLITLPIGIALLCWLLLGLHGLRDALRDSRRWWLLWWLLLTAWTLLSPTWARYGEVAGNSALQFLAVAAVGVMAFCTPLSARALIGALAAGALVQSVVIIGQVSIQDDLGLRALGELNLYAGRQGLSVLHAADLRLLRPYGLSVHPNVVGGYLAVSLLALSAWLFESCAKWRYIVRALTFTLCLFALCLTFSRSAWIACLLVALGLGIWSVRARAWDRAALRRALWAGALGIFSIGTFSAAYMPFLLARAGVNSETVEQISVAQRGIFIEFAWQIIREYPIAGTGIGTFAWEARDRLVRSPHRGLVRAENVHSVPLLVLSELGIIGFALWSAALAAWAYAAWRARQNIERVALGAGVGALLVTSTVDFYPFGIFSIHCLWLLLMGASAHKKC